MGVSGVWSSPWGGATGEGGVGVSGARGAKWVCLVRGGMGVSVDGRSGCV